MGIRESWLQAATVAVDSQTKELLVRTGGAVTPKRVKVDCASAAAAGNELIAPVAGKTICVLSGLLMFGGDSDAAFYSGPADALDPDKKISGTMSLAKGGFIIPDPSDPQSHSLRTAVGDGLTLWLGTSVQVGGWLVYYEE
jgi:hypothetical protein